MDSDDELTRLEAAANELSGSSENNEELLLDSGQDPRIQEREIELPSTSTYSLSDLTSNLFKSPSCITQSSTLSKVSIGVHAAIGNDNTNEEIELVDNQINTAEMHTVVFVHIETIRSSKCSKVKLTQVGCSSKCPGSRRSSFFRAIKPRGIDNYLDNYQLGGDLLSALHMAREEDRSFQFRGQFEIVTDPSKLIVCTSEKAALIDLFSFMCNDMNGKVVLVALEENSLAILVGKLISLYPDVFREVVVGFTSWQRILRCLDISKYEEIEIEEFCSIKRIRLNNNLFIGSQYKSAEDISQVLQKSVNLLLKEYCESNNCHQSKDDVLLHKTCEGIYYLDRPKKVICDKDTDNETIEVLNSFRPVSTTISVRKREEVYISSDSEEDIFVETPEKDMTEDLIEISSDSEEELTDNQCDHERVDHVTQHNPMDDQRASNTDLMTATTNDSSDINNNKQAKTKDQFVEIGFITAVRLGYVHDPQIESSGVQPTLNHNIEANDNLTNPTANEPLIVDTSANPGSNTQPSFTTLSPDPFSSYKNKHKSSYKTSVKPRFRPMKQAHNRFIFQYGPPPWHFGTIPRPHFWRPYPMQHIPIPRPHFWRPYPMQHIPRYLGWPSYCRDNFRAPWGSNY